MSTETTLSLLAAILALAVASLAALWTARSSSSFLRAASLRKKGYSRIGFGDEGEGSGLGLYEDEDGTATQDSQDAYSLRLPKVLTGIWALVAVSLSVLNLVWSTSKPDKSPLLPSWLFPAAWVSKNKMTE